MIRLQFKHGILCVLIPQPDSNNQACQPQTRKISHHLSSVVKYLSRVYGQISMPGNHTKITTNPEEERNENHSKPRRCSNGDFAEHWQHQCC
jgi:hypothetical protein